MTAYDWSVLDELGEHLDLIVTGAVRRLRRQRDGSDNLTIEAADAEQDAMVLLAGNAVRVRQLAAEESWGWITRELHLDLLDKYRPAMRKDSLTESFEDRYTEEEGKASAFAPAQAQQAYGGGYTSELVERLLPAVWDPDFFYGMKVDHAPDKEMPRTKSNPAHGNTLIAHVADIKTGWERTNLTRLERRALFLRFGMDWARDDIARHEGVSGPVISTRITTAVAKVATALNNNPYYQIPASVAVQEVAA